MKSSGLRILGIAMAMTGYAYAGKHFHDWQWCVAIAVGYAGMIIFGENYKKREG